MPPKKSRGGGKKRKTKGDELPSDAAFEPTETFKKESGKVGRPKKAEAAKKKAKEKAKEKPVKIPRKSGNFAMFAARIF